jgi:hypothetical protein
MASWIGVFGEVPTTSPTIGIRFDGCGMPVVSIVLVIVVPRSDGAFTLDPSLAAPTGLRHERDYKNM